METLPETLLLYPETLGSRAAVIQEARLEGTRCLHRRQTVSQTEMLHSHIQGLRK